MILEVHEDRIVRSAVLVWPVEFIGGTSENLTDLHCTIAYWPDVEAAQGHFFETMERDSYLLPRLRQWRVANVAGVAAFGENEDHPVLLANDTRSITTLHEIHARVVSAFRRNLHKVDQPDTTFVYKPHVTVDLKTLVRPPKELIFKPAELWYKDYPHEKV